ncbi:MAG: bifunctional demethylmenaquinone methyltransferase/2-methoxy-6-polyprenyl-1,4-benzoquinol methylase [Rickettsiales bacterium]|nr:bifunctional demethylmenaquinone methyltransferase/2-methoxy-6-polyprenyl-1,4-benzoquinol methylase [Rickettsiales bacterium]|tara:strand:+ start:1485 stop:2264 length:780 start_codon:yes stop_codon:yes gene_type:complete
MFDADPSKKTTTSYGFKTVSFSEKREGVQSIFSAVSDQYDLMNDLMSGFQHRLWKKWFVADFPLKPNLKHIDVATGTGDITAALVRRLERQNLEYQITATDFNNAMLQKGKNRLIDKGIFKNISWQQANAEELPFESDYFDSYSIAFGIRNVANIPEALAEAYRCLVSGGSFHCLEFSQPDNQVVKMAYDRYAFNVLPLIGKLVAKNRPAYQYLVESIETFMKPEEFSHLLVEAGFRNISVKSYAGGLVRAYHAWKEKE